MEPLTIAGIVTIVLTGALTKVGKNALDGSLKRLSELLQQNVPETYLKLISSQDNTEALPEVIEIMAETIKDDDEIKKLSENKSITVFYAITHPQKINLDRYLNQQDKDLLNFLRLIKAKSK